MIFQKKNIDCKNKGHEETRKKKITCRFSCAKSETKIKERRRTQKNRTLLHKKVCLME